MMILKDKKLKKALQKNDIEMAKSCVKAGASCEKKWLDGFLFNSISYGNLNSIKTYVESGLDIEHLIKIDELTMLHVAAHHGQKNIVKYLISQNAQADVYSASRQSILYYVAYCDMPTVPDIIKILTKAGASLNFQQPNILRTALMTASDRNKPNITRVFIDLGADQSLTDSQGETAWNLSQIDTAPLFPEYKEQQKEKAIEQQKINAKNAEIKKNGVWSPCFNQSIACIQTSDEIHRELTEIFNFSSRNVTTIIQNTKTNFESHSKEGFAEYANKSRLKTACIEYNKLPNIDTPINPDEIIQIQTKVIDGQTTNKTPITINCK